MVIIPSQFSSVPFVVYHSLSSNKTHFTRRKIIPNEFLFDLYLYLLTTQILRFSHPYSAEFRDLGLLLTNVKGSAGIRCLSFGVR